MAAFIHLAKSNSAYVVESKLHDMVLMTSNASQSILFAVGSNEDSLTMKMQNGQVGMKKLSLSNITIGDTLFIPENTGEPVENTHGKGLVMRFSSNDTGYIESFSRNDNTLYDLAVRANTVSFSVDPNPKALPTLFVENSTGNVGIGGTSNPTEKLHVEGSIKATGSNFALGSKRAMQSSNSSLVLNSENEFSAGVRLNNSVGIATDPHPDFAIITTNPAAFPRVQLGHSSNLPLSPDNLNIRVASNGDGITFENQTASIKYVGSNATVLSSIVLSNNAVEIPYGDFCVSSNVKFGTLGGEILTTHNSLDIMGSLSNGVRTINAFGNFVVSNEITEGTTTLSNKYVKLTGGDTIQGTLTAPVFNATSNLQEAGAPLNTRYMLSNQQSNFLTLSGGTLTGMLTGTTINITENLQENGSNLVSKYALSNSLSNTHSTISALSNTLSNFLTVSPSGEIQVSKITPRSGILDIATDSNITNINIGVSTSGNKTINIGGSNDVVNIMGSLYSSNSSGSSSLSGNIVRLNVDGGPETGSNVGINIMEDSNVAGYIVTSATRDSWLFKTPAGSNEMSMKISNNTTNFNNGALILKSNGADICVRNSGAIINIGGVADTVNIPGTLVSANISGGGGGGTGYIDTQNENTPYSDAPTFPDFDIGFIDYVNTDPDLLVIPSISIGEGISPLGTTSLVSTLFRIGDFSDPTKTLTLNKDNGVGSGANAGMEIAEEGIVTSYIKTTADRNGFVFKAPAGSNEYTVDLQENGFNFSKYSLYVVGQSNGVVGIGTPSPNPTYKLDVGGTVNATAYNNLPIATTTTAGIVSLNDTYTSTSTTEAATASALKSVYDSLSAGTTSWQSNATGLYNMNRVGIYTSNVVSYTTIGTPVVDSNVYVHSSAVATITLQSPATSAVTLNDSKPVLHLCRQGTGGVSYGARATFALSRYEANALNSRTRMDIILAHGQYTDCNVLTALSSGRIGIAHSNPEQRLHVHTGDIKVSNTTGTSKIMLAGYNDTKQHSVIANNENLDFDSVSPAGTGAIRFLTGSNATTSEKIRIATNGYLGIGTPTPSYLLHLNADSAAKPSTNTWTVSSDERLKENIIPANLEACYSNIKQIPLKYFKWRDDIYTPEQVKDRHKLGWIAQDVEAVFPKAVEIVPMPNIPDCRSLNSDQLIASLYGCVQKMQQVIEEQATEMRNLWIAFSNLVK